MWFLFAGKLMSVLCFFVFFQGVADPLNLDIVNRLFGWFFLEHLFEDYEINAGKFFLINVDFRKLIKNFLIVVRNIIIWSHLLTFAEFLLTGSTLFLLVYFLFYFVKTKIKYSDKTILFILIYYTFILYVLFLKTLNSFNLFDVCFLLKPISVVLLIFSLVFCLVTFFLNGFFLSLCNQTKLVYKTILFKIGVIFVCSIFSVTTFVNNVLIVNNFNNNFFQESCVKLTFIYSYFYYLTLKYINANNKSIM